MTLYTICLTRDITESSVVEVEAHALALDPADDVTFHVDDSCEGVYVSWMEEE